MFIKEAQRRSAEVLRALPDVFTVMPATNYQAMVSHDSGALFYKAGTYTNNQVRKAWSSVQRECKVKDGNW